MRCQRIGRSFDECVTRDRRGVSLVEYILVVGLIALIGLAGFRVFGGTVSDAANRQADDVARLHPEAGGAVPSENGFLPPPSTTTPWIAQSPAHLTGSDATRLAEARALVRAGGSADSSDADLVAAEVAKLPPEALQRLRARGTRVVAARGSITDYLTELKGVHPRGWAPGATWDAVPGIYYRAKNEVVIATIGSESGHAHVPRQGEGHGAYNLVIHECFHALDGNRDVLSSADAFEDARDADKQVLPPYELQSGKAGYEESFAESAAQYYGGDPTLAKNEPHLEDYWKDDPFD